MVQKWVSVQLPGLWELLFGAGGRVRLDHP